MSERYIETVGRRKTSVARVRLTPAKTQSLVVNDKPVVEYFKTNTLQRVATEAFHVEGVSTFAVSAHVNGGGSASQAEAIRHGISRAISEHQTQLRAPLKKAGFLKRDPRTKERRKFGLKKARKAPQWSKR